jgi:hypothetical protein
MDRRGDDGGGESDQFDRPGVDVFFLFFWTWTNDSAAVLPPAVSDERPIWPVWRIMGKV